MAKDSKRIYSSRDWEIIKKKFWLCDFSARKKGREQCNYTACFLPISSITGTSKTWEKKPIEQEKFFKVAPICSLNYVKLYYETYCKKNAKANKKKFCTYIYSQFTLELTGVCECQKQKQKPLSLLFLFGKDASFGIQTKKVEKKKCSGRTKSRPLQSNFKRAHSSLQWVHVSKLNKSQWKWLKDQRTLSEHRRQTNVTWIYKIRWNMCS